MPVTDRRPRNETAAEIRGRLEALGARLLQAWSTGAGDEWAYYSLGGVAVVLQAYASGGAEVFTPITERQDLASLFFELQRLAQRDAIRNAFDV